MNLTAASLQELEEYRLVEFPGAVFIGIGQGGPAGGSDSQMLQFSLTASQPPGDLPERVGSSQLAEEHGHKLAPRAKSSAMSFGFGLFHSLDKFDFGKKL